MLNRGPDTRDDTDPAKDAAERRHGWVAALVVCVATLFVSVPALKDTEVFMRMALGRLALTDLSPASDPFLFSVDAPFANPEWLGDILLYACYSTAGELALVGLRIASVLTGSLLLLLAIRRSGASYASSAIFTCVSVLLTGHRWSERNEMHLVWMMPAYLYLVASPRPRVRWLLVPLGLAWANLHGSFLLGWPIVLAGAIRAWQHADRTAMHQLVVIGVLHPLLPLASPGGVDVYRFVWEHHMHADWLAQHVAEWMPLSMRPMTLREGALHGLVLVTLGTFFVRGNRRALDRLVVAALALILIYRAVRFAPLAAMLLSHTCAANVTAFELRRRAHILSGAAVLIACGLAAWTPRAETAARPHPLAEEAGAAGGARWLGQNVPPGSRVFHPFNQSQLLMWFAPQVKLVVTAHQPYRGFETWQAASTNAQAFETMVRTHDVRYVVTFAHATSTARGFRDYISHHPQWTRAYADRFSVVYARVP